MKVLVSINSASYPELFTEILNTPVRLRAGRIRNLASMGIMVSSKRISDANLADTSSKITDNSILETRNGNRGTEVTDNKVTKVSSQGGDVQANQETEEERKKRSKKVSKVIQKLSRSL